MMQTKARLVIAVALATLLMCLHTTTSTTTTKTAIVYVPQGDTYHASDSIITSIIQSAGFAVTTAVLNSTTISPTNNNTLVVIPSSNGNSDGKTFEHLPNPAIVFNRGIWATMGMTMAVGSYTTGTAMRFYYPESDITNGLNGSYQVLKMANTIYTSDSLALSAVALATVGEDDDASSATNTHRKDPRNAGPACIFSIEVSAGRGRRVGIGLEPDSVLQMEKTLNNVIAAAAIWAAQQGPVPPRPPPPSLLPEQIHLAYADLPTSMTMSWATPFSSDHSTQNVAVARWRPLTDSGANWTEAFAKTTTFTPGSTRQLNMHHCLLTGLPLSAEIEYQVGWATTPWKQRSVYRTRSMAPKNAPVRLAMFGDLGWTNNQILPFLANESRAGVLDGIVLYGDMVYWWGGNDGADGDSFMNDLSTMSNASVPIMVSPGNGDSERNFTNYRTRFAMPGWHMNDYADGLWYSFDIGSAHIIALSTEVLGYWSFQPAHMQERMLAWLRDDLTRATQPSVRSERPWIVVHQHRPTYSTWGDPAGDSKPQQFFESIMLEFGVDVIFAGHVHNQERTYPVANGSIVVSDPSRPYHNARAPVYIVAGNPSNAESTNIFNTGFQNWTAWRSYMFGYCHLTVYNKTTLAVDFLSTQLGGQIVDEVIITKDNTCNFGKDCARIPQHQTETTQPQRQLMKRLREQTTTAVHLSQRDALVDLYNALGGNHWNRSKGWLEGDPCVNEWYGVSCLASVDRFIASNGTPGVTAIQLASNNLIGALPEGIFEALSTSLQLLDLSSNRITGTLPADLWSLPHLHTLYLHPKFDDDVGYSISGTLPADMGSRLPNLRYLGLERNALTGSVPSNLGALPCHTTSATSTEPGCLIWLFKNRLNGPVPSEWCDATFSEVYLADNDLSCPQPCLHLSYGTSDCKEPCAKCP